MNNNPYAVGAAVEQSRAAGSSSPGQPVALGYRLASTVSIVFAAFTGLLSCVVMYQHVTGPGGWGTLYVQPKFHWALILLNFFCSIVLMYAAVQWRRPHFWRAGIASLVAVAGMVELIYGPQVVRVLLP